MDGSRPLPLVCADLDRLREELRQLHATAQNTAATGRGHGAPGSHAELVVRGK